MHNVNPNSPIEFSSSPSSYSSDNQDQDIFSTTLSEIPASLNHSTIIDNSSTSLLFSGPGLVLSTVEQNDDFKIENII